jgi:hypothetical protein
MGRVCEPPSSVWLCSGLCSLWYQFNRLCVHE